MSEVDKGFAERQPKADWSVVDPFTTPGGLAQAALAAWTERLFRYRSNDGVADLRPLTDRAGSGFRPAD